MFVIALYVEVVGLSVRFSCIFRDVVCRWKNGEVFGIIWDRRWGRC